MLTEEPTSCDYLFPLCICISDMTSTHQPLRVSSTSVVGTIRNNHQALDTLRHMPQQILSQNNTLQGK